jgi:molecular chaperone DnaK
MIREAERHAAEDAEKKELIEAVNQAESVVHDTQSKLTEYADQLNADETKALNEKINELKTKLDNRDSVKAGKHLTLNYSTLNSLAEVKELLSAVQQQSLKLFEAAYKKMAAQNQQSGGASNEQKPEEPAEGEKKSESK